MQLRAKARGKDNQTSEKKMQNMNNLKMFILERPGMEIIKFHKQQQQKKRKERTKTKQDYSLNAHFFPLMAVIMKAYPITMQHFQKKVFVYS